MPCYLKNLDALGVKIVNVHPRNPVKFGIPTIAALLLLLKPQTGEPIAMLEATWLTKLRTGAVSGVATKWLARKNSRKVGMIGVGAQAPYQLLALREVLARLEKIKIISKTREKSEEFAKKMSKELRIEIQVASTIEELVNDSDVLVTVTPATKPLVKDSWVREGTHINAIGADAPGKEELDPKLLLRAKIVVDDIEQALHSGEINMPISKGILTKKNIYAELGEIIAKKKKSRVSDKEITLFDSTGLALQDIVVGWLVYKKALNAGIGKFIKL
jgi:alanine dehydrogenase